MTNQQGDWIIDLLKQILQRMSGPQRIDADTIALEAAKRIEDIFAIGGCGRTQRLARIQIEVLAATSRAKSDESSILQDDLRDMLRALGLPDGARPQSPHEVFRECIVAVERMRAALSKAEPTR